MSDWHSLSVLAVAHREGLARLEALEQAAQQFGHGGNRDPLVVFRDSLAFFESELQQHFRHEEQALFPALAKVIGRSGPVGAMLGEHESLWLAVDDFADAVEGLDQPGAVIDEATARRVERLAMHIVFLLRGHIKREDDMLFPLANKTLDARAKRGVDQDIRLLDERRQSSDVT